MSRVGKLPIPMPAGVDVDITAGQITVSGPKGTLSQKLLPGITLRPDGEYLRCERGGESRRLRAQHGLMRALVANMVHGVSQGFEKRLEVQGVGYRAAVNGSLLDLNLGYSHPVVYAVPEGIVIQVERNIITVSGIDRQKVGQVAADIRAKRPPEPYKGKGVRYVGEVVRRKAGKAAR